MEGIINVYKEQGFTSFDVIAKLRGILKIKKIGHTGTLDPMAEGVLPVCVGKATKVCGLLTDADKTYRAQFKLGLVSDTQDITGTVLAENSCEGINDSDILDAVKSFEGEINQLTPMYSARKVDGKKLYEYAREGRVAERPVKRIRIFSIRDVEIKRNEDGVYVSMEVNCEKGTYIRTLCHDIGEKLGCGVVMTALTHTQTSIFTIENSLKLKDIENIVSAGREDAIFIGVDTLFLAEDKVTVPDELMKYVVNGNKLRLDNFDLLIAEDKRVRLYSEDGTFLALYVNKNGELRPEALFI